MSPAMPAAGIAWPIIDLTEPRPHQGSPSARGPNTRVRAWTSVASPTGVPVPCASTRPTLRGETPADS